MNKFILLSVALLWLTYSWSPVAAQGADRCAKYNTNATCLSEGGCGCAFLLCGGAKFCLAANETTGRPLNMPTCSNFQWWYNCTRSNGPSAGGEESSAVKTVLIILAVVIVVGAAVGIFVWYRARRRNYSTVA